MDCRSLSQFVALAEELHFGRAAQRLATTQPLVSKSVQRLERQLGVKLVDRSSRSVALTPCGSTFATEARLLLQQLDFVERLVKRTAQGELATLTIGLVAPALHRILPRMLEMLRSRLPKLEVRLEELPSEEQVRQLREGRIDLAITSPGHADLQGLEVRPVEGSTPIAAIPADWPLAARSELRLADLKDCPFITTPCQRFPESHAGFVSACLNAGFMPQIVQEATQTNTRLNFVAAGLGIAFVAETARHTEYHRVRFVPVVDLPHDMGRWELWIVWVPHGVTEPLRTAIECFDAASKELKALPQNTSFKLDRLCSSSARSKPQDESQA